VALTQVAENLTSRPPGEMPEITEMVMPSSHRDEEMTAPRVSTDVEYEPSDGEPDDEHRDESQARRTRSLDSFRRIPRNIEPEYILPAEESAETPRNKGKVVDPRNWGNVNFEPDELNIDLQEELFHAYERGREHPKRNDKTPRDTKPENRRDTPISKAQNLEAQRAGSRPAAQIVPESSLGVALGNVARLVEDPEDPDDPSGSSSDYESSYSRSNRSRSSSRSRRHRRSRSSKKGSRKRSRRSSRKSRTSTRSSIKPIPPKDYNGAADSRAYHRFVMEGEAYLRDGKVPRARHIRILAYYLEGKAYNFYMQKVASDDPKNWDLHKFFTELFNYCFPVDYRQRMRIKLEDFHQRQNQPVSEFVFELQELFSMVGAIPAEMKVIKLWYGLNTRMQKALWRDGLHPDSSTWDEVITKAEVVEIADNVVNRREFRDGPRPQSQKGWRSNNSENDRKRNPDPTLRSITYDQRNNGSGSHGKEQPRQAAQPRQTSAQSAGKNGNSSSSFKSKGTWKKGGTPKKSVKFADLSEQEMAQLRAEGRCFLCKDVGHLSRNCPRKNTMSGNGNNKPPGVPSYSMSMEMSLLEDDNDTNNVLKSMPVGSVNVMSAEEPEIVPDETWREDYPFWQNADALAREKLGNCYEMTAESFLTRSQPYPGDGLLNETAHECAPFNRFSVKQSRTNPNNFRIHDLYNDFKIIVPKSRLENPRFNLAHWYAKERARTQNMDKPDKLSYPPHFENPVALVTFHLLRNGVSSHFPNTSIRLSYIFLTSCNRNSPGRRIAKRRRNRCVK
jgi:hypothetical protein